MKIPIVFILAFAIQIQAVYRSCKCGLAKRNHRMAAQRVVGGSVTEINEYPWTIYFSEGGHECGGSLISDQWILTAKHCIDNKPLRVWRVKLGDHDKRTEYETRSLEVGVSRLIKHPTLDAALVKLARKIDFNRHNNIRPVCLPSHYQSYLGATATIVGWGQTGFHRDVSPVLKETNLKVSDCRNFGIHNRGMICGDFDRTGPIQSGCNGDSGGPFFTSNGGDGITPGQNNELIGIVSGGAKCQGYSGFVRITAIMGWIMKNVGYLNTCPRT